MMAPMDSHAFSDDEGGRGYECKSQEEWKELANSACEQGRDMAHFCVKAIQHLRDSTEKLESRVRELKGTNWKGPYDDSVYDPDTFMQVSSKLTLSLENAEIEQRDRRKDYDEAKVQLLNLLCAAQTSKSQAESWTKPTSSTQFSDCIDDNALYHEMEVEFLEAIINQLQDTLFCMEEDIVEAEGKPIEDRYPKYRQVAKYQRMPGLEYSGPEELPHLPPSPLDTFSSPEPRPPVDYGQGGAWNGPGSLPGLPSDFLE